MLTTFNLTKEIKNMEVVSWLEKHAPKISQNEALSLVSWSRLLNESCRSSHGVSRKLKNTKFHGVMKEIRTFENRHRNCHQLDSLLPQLGEDICLGYTHWFAMKFWANVLHSMRELWLKFCDFIMDRFGDRNFSFIVGPAGQFWRKWRELELLGLFCSLPCIIVVPLDIF